MEINKLIPEKYFYYLEKFTRSAYKAAFEQYCRETAGVFSAFDAQPEMCKNAAMQLIVHIESLLPKRFRRKLIYFDLKRLVFLYVVPAALEHGSEQCYNFVEALQSAWNEKYPNDVLNAAKFDEINGSFNNTIMGFQFGGSN